MRYLTLGEVLELHGRLMARSGGQASLAHLPGLESALALPRQVFGGADLYPSLPEKAGILGFALIQNHPFTDGNKRIGHAAMETFLWLNGFELSATVAEAEAAILATAAGSWTKDDLIGWVQAHLVRRA
ncbi:MAG: Fic family protein [Gemmatimonadetes bacterium]|nr:Fic family protein [Gemmatimonadota bacterium]